MFLCEGERRSPVVGLPPRNRLPTFSNRCSAWPSCLPTWMPPTVWRLLCATTSRWKIRFHLKGRRIGKNLWRRIRGEWD